ncbi:hypothetical protein BJ875DRAFT_480771 [Amylocarpus encephaloides]|uniref:Actin-like ATPase domain-containing protein n=1 Tax=Amylocarpus encephaloides TaxID=45428 RepID=A0A9P8CAB1_9HELO|nr:hypothetical protein BJ875DRAFT_480771 [Amylocarpus encephaloides]
MPCSNDTKVEVLIAVDFGTTFSGLCWALKDQNWPGEGASHNKAPTTLLYKNNGSHLWGYEIKGAEPRYEWFKLGLQPSGEREGLAKEYPSITALTAHSDEDKVRLVIDYLTDLRKHAEKIMSSTYGEFLFPRMTREYIITVPAVWDDKAQSKTQYCAQKAGMGDHVQIITEPEAAGIYALSSIPTVALKKNDIFVLCDAGGGTVDLVSYTISKLHPVPRLCEAARGEGGLCGSIFLNRIFAKYLDNKFVNFPEWKEGGYQTDAMRTFEDEIKKNFIGDLSQEYLIPARGLRKPELGIQNGTLKLSGMEMLRVFEPVIQQVLLLVTKQIRKTTRTVTAVLMAGGFGSSDYLRTRIQAAVGRKIEVRTVANGIPSPYSSGYVVPIMQWFIEKNANVDDTTPVVTENDFYWEQRVLEGHPKQILATIYVSEKDTQPVHLDKRDVSELVKIQADLRNVPVELFPKQRGIGLQEFYRIPYKIATTIHSGSITFAVLYGGHRYEASKEFL